MNTLEHLGHAISRIGKGYDKSGFNPAMTNGFGSGIACGLLFTFDLPATLLVGFFNLLLHTRFETLGIISWRMMWANNTTFGMIIGFVLFAGLGVGAWFNPGVFCGLIKYATVMWAGAAICLLIDLAAFAHRYLR